MSAPVILALMTACFLTFGYLGVPVPFALLGGVFVGALLSDVSLAAIIQKVFDGVDNEASACDPFLSSRRRIDELGQRGRSHRQSVDGVGRSYSRRSVAGRHRVQHVLLGNVRLNNSRRRRDEPGPRRTNEKGGLRGPIYCSDHRRCIDHRRAGPAKHYRRRLWCDRQRIDRRAVHGRFRTRADDWLRPDDLLLLLRAGRF